MIKFNRNGKVAKFHAANPFFGAMPQTRQTMFKRAFGLLGSKAHYEADLVESRRFVQGILETYASLTGATLSQVVHAVTSGRLDRFVFNLRKRILANLSVHFEKGAKGSVRVETLALAHGHRWKGNISELSLEDIEKACIDLWAAAAFVLTEQEKAQEGVEGAVAKHMADKRAESKAFSTPKKNVMAGVEVVNRRQKARQASVVA